MESRELRAIIGELEEYSKKISGEEIEAVADILAKADRIFVAGAGRTGFASRGFANRLMHLGKQTYFVGETTTPSIKPGDVLLVGSGSGSTESLVAMAKKARRIGAQVVTVTMFPDHEIGREAAASIKIPGATPKKNPEDEDSAVSIQPMGTLFEQLCWLTYDSLVMALMDKLGMTAEEMFTRHANLE